MWDTYNEDKAPRADIGRIVRIAVFSAIMVIIFAMVSNQSVNFVMNVQEFGEVYTKPLYYVGLSGMILASIALVRLNFGLRHSITWYGIKMLINFLRRGEYESQNKMSRYSEFHMSNLGFALWQLTKVILFAPIFGNMMFGMATQYIVQGNDIDLGSISSIFAIPFADIPIDGTYARQEVLPMLPALTILMPPLLAAIGLRLLLYIGVSSTVNIVSQYAIDSKESKPKFLSYISTIEIIAGVAILWIGFNMFFSSAIDYNTRYAIIGSTTIGAAFLGYGFVDRRHARVIIYPTKRHLYSRLFTAAVVVGLAGSIMIVNTIIAETRKDMNEPFVEQQIEVNRYMHGLDRIEIKDYHVGMQAITASSIPSTLKQNSGILDNIRLWDEADAKARLKQQLEQSDLAYFDFDLLRFNDKMYWTGTVMPLIPSGVAPKDAWINQHFIYTHSEIGMKMFEADNGDFVDENQFFNQHRVYYGESAEPGVFTNYWSAYATAGTRSEEVGGAIYNGTGGVEVAPPLSWMFEPNFIAYTNTPVNILRYKDIHDRMDLLYPYFVYDFCFDCTPSNPQPKKVEAFMVTDGPKTYWLMPLVAAVNTSNIPWSTPSSTGFMLKLVGYSLIDAYDGTVRIIVTGDDFFSKMFFEEYKNLGATRDVPEWLTNQIRYPEEMFIWQISKFNTYHVTDPKTFIETKDFYAIADDASELAPHYVFAEPPGFTDPEFIGLQPIELKEPKSTNLSGYMVVQNNLQNLGKMTFYSIPSNSTAKLIDPLAAKNTFKESEEFKEAKKSIGNSNPTFGELSLYKVGEYEVYFIPLFAEPGGKLGVVAVVGAASIEGTYQIGLGSSPTSAFENYLQKLSGIVPSEPTSIGNQTTSDTTDKKHNLERAFGNSGLTVIEPTNVSTPVEFREAAVVYKEDVDFPQVEAAIHEFITKFAPQGGRIYEWQDGTTINFGVLREVEGIVENHYISVEVS